MYDYGPRDCESASEESRYQRNDYLFIFHADSPATHIPKPQAGFVL